MDDDWDLQAVVRGCCATTTTPSTSSSTTTTSTPATTTNTSTTTTTATSSCAVDFNSYSRFQPPRQVQESNLLCFRDLFEPRNESSPIEDLCDLYKPFFSKPSAPQPASFSPKTMPVSPLSVLGAFQDLSSQQQQLLQTQLQPKQLPSSGVPRSGHTTASNGTTHTQSPRSKRRKNQMKRVCQVPAEGLSSDMWSWRKYGQKPIKGSPYPRGYYRCSTSKGCLARKQVERNRSDPSMFIVTYTAEHNHPMPTHRNSLAGSTRMKPTTSGDTNKPTCSPPESPAAKLSPAPEKLESSREEKDDIIEEDDDDFAVSDMPLDDDFFAGLGDDLAVPSPVHGDCFSDHFPANGQFPWLVSNATTTAAGGS